MNLGRVDMIGFLRWREKKKPAGSGGPFWRRSDFRRSGSPSMVARRGGVIVPPPMPGVRGGRRRKGASGAGGDRADRHHDPQIPAKRFLVKVFLSRPSRERRGPPRSGGR